MLYAMLEKVNFLSSCNSARSLYHAILAQSAYHLSNLRDVESACHERKLATDYIELQHSGTFSIWTVYIAATQAYTPELQTSAIQCLDLAATSGTGNRRKVQRVVRQVWLEREAIAREVRCDPGTVFVNWRNIMKALNGSVLLL